VAKRIIWAKSAVADRFSILDYWNQVTGSKSYSAYLDSKFRKIVQLLARFPHMGKTLDQRNERVFIIEYYLIVYGITPHSIEILYIWDSRRDPEDFPLTT
jgi:plasmid stabilization system protein ParE